MLADLPRRASLLRNPSASSSTRMAAEVPIIAEGNKVLALTPSPHRNMSPSAGEKYQAFAGISPLLSTHHEIGAANGRTLKPWAVKASCSDGSRQRNTSISTCPRYSRRNAEAIAGKDF